MKRDLLFVAERLASLLDENRLSIVARRYGIKKAKDTDSLAKLFAAYLRRAEESVLGSVLVETTILYMSTRHNPAQVLHEAAAAVQGGHRRHRPQGQAGVRGEREGEEGSAASRQGREESCLAATGTRAANLPPFACFVCAVKRRQGDTWPVSPCTHFQLPSGLSPAGCAARSRVPPPCILSLYCLRRSSRGMGRRKSTRPPRDTHQLGKCSGYTSLRLLLLRPESMAVRIEPGCKRKLLDTRLAYEIDRAPIGIEVRTPREFVL